MQSQWYNLKPEAIKLRKRGFSITKIEKRLGVARSTLSGWFKNIKLNPKQKKILSQNSKKGLIKARKKAVLWHNIQKQKRIREARMDATKSLENIDSKNKNIIELALAMLYLGEGSRKSPETSLANSNPEILKFFLTVIENIYNVKREKIRCELRLRMDQNPRKLKVFWANALNMPIENFKYVVLDKRTAGKKTYPHYKGVCHLRCVNVSIQRKLKYLSELFCEEIIRNNSGV